MLFPKPPQDICTAFFSELPGLIPAKPHRNITWANAQCGKEDGWPWPIFQGHTSQIRSFWYWTLTGQWRKLESSNFVSSITILGHMSYYMFSDLDLLFKVTEVKFSIFDFSTTNTAYSTVISSPVSVSDHMTRMVTDKMALPIGYLSKLYKLKIVI